MSSAFHAFRAFCLLWVLAFSGCSSAIPEPPPSSARQKLMVMLTVDRDGRPQSAEVSGGGADSEDIRQHVRKFILENWKLHQAKPEDPSLRKFKVPIYFTLKDPDEKPQPQDHRHSSFQLFPKKPPPARSSSPPPTP